jgi:hypothetical protein
MDIAVPSQRLLSSKLELCLWFAGESRLLVSPVKAWAVEPRPVMSLPMSQRYDTKIRY